MKETIYYEDILYGVDIEVNDYDMNFKAYVIVPCYGCGKKTIEFKKRDVNGFEVTENKQESEIFIEGYIKWDGCINYIYSTQETCMLHHCGLRGYKVEVELMTRLFKLASDKIPYASKDMILD